MTGGRRFSAGGVAGTLERKLQPPHSLLKNPSRYHSEESRPGRDDEESTVFLDSCEKQILRFAESEGLHRSPDIGPRFARNENMKARLLPSA